MVNQMHGNSDTTYADDTTKADFLGFAGRISNPPVVRSSRTECISVRCDCHDAAYAGKVHKPNTRLTALCVLERSAPNSASLELSTLPAMMGCVYLLYLGRELVYIGQTANLLVRLGKHQEGGKVFDRVRYAYFPDADERLAVETRLIKRYSPRLNKKMVLFTKRRPEQVYGAQFLVPMPPVVIPPPEEPKVQYGRGELALAPAPTRGVGERNQTP